MGISLKKGDKISLKKPNEVLNKIIIGLGWDQTTKKSGFFSLLFGEQTQVDCDSSAIMLKKGKLASNNDVVYYGNLRHNSKSIIHSGDNLTGEGSGDDEQLIVELSKIPNEYDRVVFVTNIFKAKKRNQHFGLLKNAYIRVVNSDNNNEICKYKLTENYDGKTAMIFGEIVKENEEWKFNAIGEATSDDDLSSIIKRYK